MRKSEIRALDRYARAMQARLGLNGWRIDREYHEDDHLPERVRGEDHGDNCVGTSDAWPDIEQARIYVACDDEECAPRDVVRHELLHVLLSPLRGALDRLRPQVAPAAWEVAWDVYRDAEELAVRRLTVALGEDHDEDDAECDT